MSKYDHLETEDIIDNLYDTFVLNPANELELYRKWIPILREKYHAEIKKSSYSANPADGEGGRRNPCYSCQTWDMPEACYYCTRR